MDNRIDSLKEGNFSLFFISLVNPDYFFNGLMGIIGFLPLEYPLWGERGSPLLRVWGIFL